MAKSFKPDEINYIVNASTSDAQKHLHELTKSTKDLRKEEKLRRDAMLELEANGKKNTDEYRRLSTEASKYTKAIKDNNREMSRLTKSMSTSDMTMTQLKKHAKELTAQLDNMSESADPKTYNELAGRLRDVRSRMEELRSRARDTNREMSASAKIFDKVKLAVKAFIAVKVVQYLKEVHDRAKDTRAEFQKYEKVLGNTLGTQKKANEAMRMLQNLAKNTPSSMAEWTAAYIKLVNRGINPTAVELTKLGDIAASQGKSTDMFIEAILDAMSGENERLKEFGITAKKNGDITAYTFKGVTTEVSNNAEAIKSYLVGLGDMQGVAGSMAVQMDTLVGKQSNLGDAMDDFFNRIGKKMEPFWNKFYELGNKFFSSMSSWFTTYTEEYDVHFASMVSLESEVPQLMDRYEELANKSNRSAQENDELATVIQRVTSMIPGAADAFDEYGRAISLSSDKVEKYIANQQALLQYENQKAIKETTSDIKDLRRELALLTEQQKQGGVQTTTIMPGPYGMQKTALDSSPETLAQIDADIARVSNKLLGAEEKLKELTGQSLEEAVVAQRQMAEARSSFNSMNASELQQWISDEANAASKYKDIAKEILDAKLEIENPGGGSSSPSASKSGKSSSKSDEKLRERLAKEREEYMSHLEQLKTIHYSYEEEKVVHEKTYQEKVQQLSLEYLTSSLELLGLDHDQRIAYEQQVLDFKKHCLEEESNLIRENALQQMNTLGQTVFEQNKANFEMKQDEAKALQQRQMRYASFGKQIGQSVSLLIGKQEGALARFGDTVIDITFDVLSRIIESQIIELTATGVKTSAEGSANMFAKHGPIVGAIEAAALTALIAGGIAAAKTALQNLIHKKSGGGSGSRGAGGRSYTYTPGREEGGSIDVVRSQDGKTFAGADYAPSRRGYISRPTVIVGEGPIGQSKEWVASNAAVSNPTVAPVLAMIDRAQSAGQLANFDLNHALLTKIAGFEAGGSIANAVPMVTGGTDAASLAVLQKLAVVLSNLETTGIPATVSLSQLDAARALQNMSRNLGSK